MVTDQTGTSIQSVTFRCPKCNSLCAFAKHHAGRGARCLTCNHRFTIPDHDGQKPTSITTEMDPLPGYYRRALCDSWKIFINPNNLKIMIFLASLVSLEYFIGFTDFSFNMPGFRLQLPLGIITVFIVNGCLFCYYFQIVASAAFSMDDLPDVELDVGFAFFWNIIKSIYLFIVAFLLPLVPFAIIVSIIENADIELPLFAKIPMFLVGCFFFPMTILTIASGRGTWLAFDPRVMITPVFRAFGQYFTAAFLTGLAVITQFLVTYLTIGGFQEMIKKGPMIATIALLGCIAARMLNIIAMRSIGLFAQHYSCYLPQIQIED